MSLKHCDAVLRSLGGNTANFTDTVEIPYVESDNDSDSSDSTYAYNDAHMEITLCLPQTKSFLNARSHKQKALYFERYALLRNHYKHWITRSEHAFEFTKQGQIHMHALLDLNTPDRGFSPEGFVSDFVKLWLFSLTKKYQQFKPKCITWFDDDKTVVYRDASIKVAFKYDQPERRDVWHEYINKYSAGIVYDREIEAQIEAHQKAIQKETEGYEEENN